VKVCKHPVYDYILHKPFSWEEKLEIEDGMLKVPDGPGIGVTPNEKAIKENCLPGEPYWD
jgi:L-alanine-DL-glutamate epimerase-like enolase superfamily enzyme